MFFSAGALHRRHSAIEKGRDVLSAEVRGVVCSHEKRDVDRNDLILLK